MPGVIRPLAEADRDEWRALWDGYLDFYRAVVPEEVTRTTFERLCTRSHGMFGLVAQGDGGLVGLVHALVHPTTWEVGPNCYLEDLFVARAARGGGIGRALIDAVVAEADARGAAAVYWHTQSFNAPGRSLYDTVAQLRSWVVYEIELPGGSSGTGS